MSGLPSPSFRMPVWILVLAASVFSAVVVAKLFQNMLPGLLTLLGGLLLTLITSLVTGVGLQFQNILGPRFFAWGDRHIRGIGYEQRYRRYVLSENRFLDISGLPTQPEKGFRLANVFVEPYLVNKPVQRTSTNLINPPDTQEGEPQRIWAYLEQIGEHLVILGVPGSGKTTLLRHIVRELSERKKRRTLATPNPHPLPFLLFLRNYGETIKDSSTFLSLVEMIETELSKREKPPPGWVEHQLMRRGSLVLLDGLDEVADEATRRSMVHWVQQQMAACNQSRFVLTSRPYGYKGNELLSPIVLEVQSFTSEQISQCIERWYLERLTTWGGRQDDEVRMEAREKAGDLRRRLHRKPVLWKLAINPFLLHMIAMVHCYGHTLPEKRVELYKEVCEVFLGRRDEARGLTHPLIPSQQQWVLEDLAYQLMLKQKLTIAREQAEVLVAWSLTEVDPTLSPKKFLDLVEKRSGLLQEVDVGIYSFAHKAFQEFLVATYIGKRGQVQELMTRVGDDWWRETILLYCAQNDATPLIEACLAGDSPSISALRLALECRNEAHRLQPGMRTRLDALLSQEAADQDPIKRRDVAEALLEIRLSDNQLIPLSEAEEAFVSPSFISCAEYQLFLDEQQGDDVGQVAAPDHWKEAHFPPGYGQQPILGMRPSDAMGFCTWLTSWDGGTWHYRFPTSNEQDTVRVQLDDAEKRPPGCGFWVNSGMELAWVKGGPKLAERLIQERFNQDRDQLANTHQVTELGDIAGCLDGLQGLAHLRLHHQELARTLMRIRDRLRERERSLQSRYGQAKAEVVRRKSELRRVQEEQSSARADLATVLRGSLNNQKVDDRIQSISEFTLHKKNEERLNQLTAQYSEVDAELAGVKRERAPLEEAIERESRRWFPSKRRLVGLQENRTYLSNQQKKLEGRLAQIERERNQLRKQKMQTSRPVSQDRATRATRTVDYTRKKAIEDRLARLGENETAMKAELKEAQEQQKALEAQLSQLTAFTRSLSYLCDEMLAVALSYNSDQMLTRVLARNRALNFDYVLARPARNTSAAALRSIGSLTRAHTRDVIAAVAQFTSTASGIVEVQDLSKLNDLSRELAGILEHATFQRYVELLADTFHSLLAELITQRPLGQASLLLRAAVRYCAWGLAECLSYWLATVQVSASQSPNQPGRQGVNPQHVLDAYLDIAVTLALLEERIEGSLQPNEGIVLVRERRENVQQAAP